MIRDDRFLISRRPYAVDLTSLHTQAPSRARINAVWYRRRNGSTVACIGHLWDIQRPLPTSAAEFLARHDDGRYGGRCEGRWDGAWYWGAQEPAVMEQHLEVLRPMLAAYPAVPPGYDGWWRF
ncbi:hypothetical protein [Streptomyces sp. DH12]|uniref:hypothetical protein n=1 Tax=Streptomyces sp. DH12 TaxID=2857010 RepID=UPI001E3CBA00|nr:hypothetical protein [Streptomyces sp. DH12]